MQSGSLFFPMSPNPSDPHVNARIRIIAAAREMFARRTGGEAKGIHPSLKWEVFGIVAKYGGKEDLGKLLCLWLTSPSEEEKYLALECLGRAGTAELIRWVLELAFTKDVKDQDVSFPKDEARHHVQENPLI